MPNILNCDQRRLFLALVLSALAFVPLKANPIDFSRYHSYGALTQALREVVNEHTDLASLVSIGTTLEGRSVWVVEIGAGGQTARNNRPAILISANFEGDYLWGSELALFIVDYLLTHYNTDENVKHQLDTHTFYIVPRVNPDGAERMFASLKTGAPINVKPYDDDNDARIDEDGPDDLNGDGLITFMRQLDAGGAYMIHPDDSTLMKKADPAKGEGGTYRIYWEGLDNDNDDFINEDGPGGININRNFQHQYPYYQREAGPHMISENESRALMDYVLSHRNIAAMLTFGEHDNLITAPDRKGELAAPVILNLEEYANQSFEEAGTVGIFQDPRLAQRRYRTQSTTDQPARSASRGPATTVNLDDLEYFTLASSKYKEMVGITDKPAVYKPEGAFFEFGYFQFGVPSFSTPGWGIPSAAADTSSTQMRGRPTRPDAENGAPEMLDVRLKKWMDALDVDGFVDWSSYEHPSLGTVEIGGFKPYITNNPPIGMVDSLGLKHASFALYLSSLCPDVRVAKTEVTNHGGGIFRIEADIENRGFWPTSLAHGVVSRTVRPTMVQLDVPPESILSGDDKTSFFQSLAGSGSRTSFQWIISGAAGDTVDLNVVSQKGGSDTVTLTLR